MAKYSKSELKAKASKTARKEAKKLTKEGWKTTPGEIPLDKQLDKSYTLQYEFGTNMYPKYIMGEAMSIGENYDAASLQATELAKQNIAAQIQTDITALIENTVSNKQLSAEQAASITETVSASKHLIVQNLGRIIPVVKTYRVLENKNKEVLVRVAYSTEMAMQILKNAVREDLEKKGEDLMEELNNLINGICPIK